MYDKAEVFTANARKRGVTAISVFVTNICFAFLQGSAMNILHHPYVYTYTHIMHHCLQAGITFAFTAFYSLHWTLSNLLRQRKITYDSLNKRRRHKTYILPLHFQSTYLNNIHMGEESLKKRFRIRFKTSTVLFVFMCHYFKEKISSMY